MASRRDGYTDETLAALVAAGRVRFGRDGYEASSLEAIAQDAGVTTGAIYHHFPGKKALFRKIAEEIESELLATALAAIGDDPWIGLTRAFEDLVDACAQSDVQRIVFLDAPRVIGPEAWREIELRYAYGALSRALAALVERGTIRAYPVELVAPVLLAVLAEVSRLVASAPHARLQALDLMGRVLGGLRVDDGR